MPGVRSGGSCSAVGVMVGVVVVTAVVVASTAVLLVVAGVVNDLVAIFCFRRMIGRFPRSGAADMSEQKRTRSRMTRMALLEDTSRILALCRAVQ